MFANVIVLDGFLGPLTYEIPSSLRSSTAPGCSVQVPLGLKKFVTGIVQSTCSDKPSAVVDKQTVELLEALPLLDAKQLCFFEWIAAYYLCPLGSVLKAALPVQLRVQGPLLFACNRHASTSLPLTPAESKIQEVLSDYAELTYEALREKTSLKTPSASLKTLLQKGLVCMRMPLPSRSNVCSAKPNLRLAAHHFQNGSVDAHLLSGLKKYKKQHAVLARYMEEVAKQPSDCPARGVVAWKELSTVSYAALKRLIQKNIFQETLDASPRHLSTTKTLQRALPSGAEHLDTIFKIQAQFQSKATVLLYGADSAHKTNVCIALIKKALERGKEVLYLVPGSEAARHTAGQFRIFLRETTVVHAHRPSDRLRMWQEMSQTDPGKGCVVVATRSGVFLPFRNLGLVVVEDEHEVYYKQTQQRPYYHARDAAIMLAHHYRAIVLLTSTTPSIATYHKTQSGRYGRVDVNSPRRRSGQPIHTSLVHMGVAYKRREVASGLSRRVLEALEKTLKSKQQALIFQGRRGYAPYIICAVCASMPHCVRCAVGLTYHSSNARLCCHYCGYHTQPSQTCQACGSHQLKNVGFGTEQIEEALRWYFPNSSIASVDSDCSASVRTQRLKRFAAKQIDVLVGTQLLAQTRFYGKVALACVLETDRLLRLPSFRSGERYFQLLTQLLSQIDPTEQDARAIIQTYHPPQTALQEAVQGHYDRMYQREVAERKLFDYPPYTRLIRVVVMHPQSSTAAAAAQRLQTMLKVDGQIQVLGPHHPKVGRIKSLFRAEIWLKIPVRGGAALLRTTKNTLLQSVEQLQREPAAKSVRFLLDVDPL